MGGESYRLFIVALLLTNTPGCVSQTIKHDQSNAAHCNNKAGAAFYKDPQTVASGFETVFKVSVVRIEALSLANINPHNPCSTSSAFQISPGHASCTSRPLMTLSKGRGPTHFVVSEVEMGLRLCWREIIWKQIRQLALCT